MKNKIQACLDVPHKSRQEGCFSVKMKIHYLQAGSKVFWISIQGKKTKNDISGNAFPYSAHPYYTEEQTTIHSASKLLKLSQCIQTY